MSTIWYYECSKCKEQSEDGINHGQEDLQIFLEIYPEINRVQEKLGKSIIEISFNLYQIYSSIDFLDKHYGHGVYPISEYGDR